MSERAEIRAGQGFSLVLAVVTFVVVLWPPDSIFGIATFSFSGYVMLVPTLYLGLCWRRFTAAAAIGSIVVGNVVLLGVFAVGAPPWGVLPVAWGLAAAIVVAVGVAWWRPRQAPRA
jgi:SSS family solute:Na+ symporter